ncbi:chaperone DNAJ protein, putative [Leishmania panamensis]|uniref:Chaperone DNAJ protein, putative n=1 Tax=Leishmania panamensis TaxID=5679 RepID=A0A088RNA8_LEIPA|nr:chaperone DNAJ protein, putative [Leishmania panamensis]AIN97320.1 chaperone DNAJ protein, putative [Leishmania panamensis]
MEVRRHYEVLCIANFSSAEEVRVAYKSLALKYHPDKNLGDPTAADRFRAVCRAYEVLSNEEAKRKYDLQLRVALAQLSHQTCGIAGAYGGANPLWMNNPTTTSDIYRELYQRQAARVSVRSRTSSAPPKYGKKAASQYTKEQHEHFRKRERERQQELCRQREKEKKEQRDRDREALRKEQERQEELLQQRWRQQQLQHQQKVYLTRGSRRTTTAANTASASTTTTSDSAAHAEGCNGALPRTRRRPSRVLTTLARNDASTTPRTCQLDSPFSPPPQLATNLRCAQTGGSGVPSPLSASREVEGGSSTDWHSPLTTSVNNSGLEEGLPRSSTPSSDARSDVEAEVQAMAQQTGVSDAIRTPRAPLSRPASGAGGASGVDSQSGVPAQPSTHTTAATCEDRGDGGAAAGCGDDHHTPSSSRRPATRIATVNVASVRATSSGATTPHQGGKSRGFTSFLAASAAAPSSLRASPRGQASTPRGFSVQATVNRRSHSLSAGVTRSRAKASRTLPRNGNNFNNVPSHSNSAHASLLHRVRPMTSLAEEDKEVLDKKRRGRQVREKERERATQLTEAERHFHRLSPVAKQSCEGTATLSAAAVVGKAKAEESLSFEGQLRYLLQDEANERDQLIEREEQLAWRRLHRQHMAVTQAVVVRRWLAALPREEVLWRNGLLQVYKAERDHYFFYFYERLDRLYVEACEGRDRRQLVGRGAADKYYLHRASQRRTSMAAGEGSQWSWFSVSATQMPLGQGMPVAGAGNRASVPTAEAKDRYHLISRIDEEADHFEDWPEAGLRLAGNHPWDQKPLQSHQRRSAEWLPSASDLLPYEAPAAGSINALGAKRSGTTSAASPAAMTGVSASGYPASFLSATSTPERAPTTAGILPGGSASVRASAQANYYEFSKQRSSFASVINPDLTVLSAVTSANGEPNILLTEARRRLLTLLSDESLQRALLVKQQQEEEMALRRRRAIALHNVFAKDREKAVKHAQRCAFVEVAVLKSQLRTLQQQTGRSSSSHRFEGGSPTAASRADSGSPTNSVSFPLESSKASRHRSPLPLLPRSTLEAATAARASLSGRARAFSAASAFTSATVLSGWTTLPDSDVEDA